MIQDSGKENPVDSPNIKNHFALPDVACLLIFLAFKKDNEWEWGSERGREKSSMCRLLKHSAVSNESL